MVAQGHESSLSYPTPSPAPTSSKYFHSCMDSLDEIFPADLSSTKKAGVITKSSPAPVVLQQNIYEFLNEDEKLELTLMISEQEFLYQTNMLEALSVQEFRDANRIATLQGVPYYKALQSLFTNKVSPVASESNSAKSASPKKVRFSDCTKDHARTSKPKRVSKKVVEPEQVTEPQVNGISSWALEMQRLAFQGFEEEKKKQEQREHQLRRIQSEEHMMYTASPIKPQALHRCVSDGVHQPHPSQPAFHSQYYPYF